jgi:hypothetical protein
LLDPIGEPLDPRARRSATAGEQPKALRILARSSLRFVALLHTPPDEAVVVQITPDRRASRRVRPCRINPCRYPDRTAR